MPIATETKKPAPPVSVTKLPSLSPYLVPNLLCSNRACNTILTNPKTGIDKDTGEQIVYFHCDNCHYDVMLSLQHSTGKCVKEGTIGLKQGPSEGLLGHARA
ncbi:MAG: hypothetical protein WA734_13955 [Candidatus Acidiferrales bacterium]